MVDGLLRLFQILEVVLEFLLGNQPLLIEFDKFLLAV
jgi:hypothetical protein